MQVVRSKLDGPLMMILKGYFDDSGDAIDPQHQACSVGGYITNADAWPSFEDDWQKALDEFEVPYLHMKGIRRSEWTLPEVEGQRTPKSRVLPAPNRGHRRALSAGIWGDSTDQRPEAVQ